MAIHNIERCRDGCRISLIIAGVVLVPAIIHTYFHPAIPTSPFIHGNNFFHLFHYYFLIHVCHIYKKRQSLLYHTYKYQPCFHGTSLHLTETSQLTDDISLCSYLAEHSYLSAFYKTIIIVIKSRSNNGNIV